MWTDSKGAVHTVAVPDPESYVDPDFLLLLRRHRAEIDDDYRDSLEDQSIAEFRMVNSQFAEEELEEQALPDGLQIGEGCAEPGEPIRDVMARAIERVPAQWRLDAVLVLGDVLDEWD